MTEPTRYLVRKGSTGWMVWDRHAREPARLEEARPAVWLHRRTGTKNQRRIAWAEGEREMVAIMLPSIFTIEIGDTPTLALEAQNLREAHELCQVQWLQNDLAEAKSNGVPLWDGKAKLRARMASPNESAMFAEVKNSGEPSDGLTLVYLVELDGDATDDESFDPG